MDFNGLTGQKEIKQRLIAASLQERSGSFLLTGPEGCGKHAFAKATAKSFLCTNKSSSGACGKCPSCLYMDASTHPDFIPVEPTDGRKNIRIADLREIVRDAEVKPQISNCKVLVINGDRLSTECQNLLLKSLEEPLPHLVYFLLCTDLSHILPTILSRVEKLAFTSYTEDEITEILKKNTDEDLSGDKLKFLTAFSSCIPGKALSLVNDSAFIEERDHIFELVMRMPTLGFTDLLYDEYQYFDKNRDKIDELLLLLTWTLGDIAEMIASPKPGSIRNADRMDELRDFVSRNRALTLINISNSEQAVSSFRDGLSVNVSFESACCNMLLHIYKEFLNAKNS